MKKSSITIILTLLFVATIGISGVVSHHRNDASASNPNEVSKSFRELGMAIKPTFILVSTASVIIPTKHFMSGPVIILSSAQPQQKIGAHLGHQTPVTSI